MIERTPFLNIATHAILVGGLLIAFLPMWLVFVAATLTIEQINSPPISLIPGGELFTNLSAAWNRADLGTRLLNSLFVAVAVAAGKITIASLTAFAIVFFRFPGRMVVFWMIFVTLMLPLEVRIVPTYAVAANALAPLQALLDVLGIAWLWQAATGVKLALEWNLLNSYTGLILPLVATATGTFLFRQFFMTIPAEIVEAARMDGARPLRFLRDMLIPLSKTNIAALFTIMFIYAWNQYLWPILVTTDRVNYGTAVMELKRLIPTAATTGGGTPDWNVAMAGCLIVMLPPLVVVALMQRYFVRGLIGADK
ncbi:MAG: ABC transporter permease subunit [Alphaproteobacteria bacterium]|nr:ABC transporter permease subunit [Alphaproteobacteria bacterium]